MTQQRFATANLDEATALLRDRYAAFTPFYSRDREGFEFAITSEAIDTDRGVAGLERLRNSMRVNALVEPFAKLTVTIPVGGWLRYQCGREETSDGPMLLPTWSRFESSWDDLDMEVVTLDPDGVRRVGAELSGLASSAVAFSGMNPVSAAAGRYLRGVLGTVRDSLLGNDVLIASPLVRDEVFRRLAIAFLVAFPNSTHAQGESLGRADGEPATVRRAIEFIDANAHRPIGLAEIAEAARLGTRSLQSAFRRYRDCTPLEYLRRARMDGAHHDLRNGDPTRGDTVAAIAARWGFGNPGRFSVEYRLRYGCPPRHTLHT